MRLVLFAALVTFGIAPPAVAQRTHSDDLEVLANFFLPGAMTEQLIRGGCRTAYQTKRSRDAADRALERDLPGVEDKMIAAASAYCDAEAPAAIARWHDSIKAEWRNSISSRDLHRLATLFRPWVREVQTISLDCRSGETATDSFERSWPKPASQTERWWTERWRAEQKAFIKTPADVALLNRVAAYQARTQKEVEDPAGPLIATIRNGLRAAHQAANAYAREKGFNAPYPGQ